MNALQLFRSGFTTIAIAKHNGITEAEAYNELSRLREEERERNRRRAEQQRMNDLWPNLRNRRVGKEERA